MLIPVRCFSCGKPVAEQWDDFVERTTPADKGGKGQTIEAALDEMDVPRTCCRRMFVGNAQLIEEILPYGRY